MHFKLWSGIALAALVIIFIVQNTAVVDIRLLFWKLSMSRSLMIFAILFIGMLIGWLGHSYYQHHKGPKA